MLITADLILYAKCFFSLKKKRASGGRGPAAKETLEGGEIAWRWVVGVPNPLALPLPQASEGGTCLGVGGR